MKLTPKAEQNFKMLFGNGDVELAKTDPEFFSNYVNFAFDEVIANSELELQERLMIILASLVAIPALSEYKTMAQAALNNKVSPVAIKEIVYQATPYIGMGKVIDFINATNAIFKHNNIALPLSPQATTTRETRFEEGLQTQRKLFGEAIDKGNAAAPADVKHIRNFLSANCFGDYYTRDGLDLKFRELLTFVYILSMGGADAQVRAHVAGNLRIGNDRAKLIAVVTALIPYIGYPRSLNALSAIDEFSPYK
ncbi:carboxymuconolactone decarboxylase [Helicobacter aurati]|uniref:Carboxymuconolactone decarboxylase n=2 Tax=Helicobacter aurati TaxID=137778 RepID=A0A3D8J6P4_9HELI|nr:carboxymuconolactone decarboxylase [Helicobacter aurati]